MKTYQQFVLDHIERLALDRGLECRLVPHATNRGTVYLATPGNPVGHSSITFDFQADTYGLSAEVCGMTVRHTPYRQQGDGSDLWRCYYTEPTSFWGTLARELDDAGFHKQAKQIKQSEMSPPLLTCHKCRHQQSTKGPCRKCGSDQVWL